MLYDNCWAIRLIAALLLTFMSHMRPVPSPQGDLVGLAPQTMHQSPLNWNMKTINLWSFVNFHNVKASTGKQKTHSSHNVGWFLPQTDTNHNVGWFSPQTHINHNVGWFLPEITLTITSGDCHPNYTNQNAVWFSPELTINHNVGWFSPRDHVAKTPV